MQNTSEQGLLLWAIHCYMRKRATLTTAVAISIKVTQGLMSQANTSTLITKKIVTLFTDIITL